MPAEMDFYDFGCSEGGSISYAMKRFGGRRGLGIDVDLVKVEAARARGFDAEAIDILALPERKQVRFVTLMHFLEHLDGYATARLMLRKACAVSREFVYVAQPFFDADGELARRGLKLYWSDWRGHTFCMSTLQLQRALESLRCEGLVRGFKIGWHSRIANSADRAVLPLSAPMDQHDYDPARHDAKPLIGFRFAVYRELRAIVDTGGADRHETESQARLGDLVIASHWSERLSVGRRAIDRARGALAFWLRR